MEQHGSRNLLLIELIIVIFFFSLSAVITLQAFVHAYEDTQENERLTSAMILAQDWAEQLYAAEDPQAFLQEKGWTSMTDGFETRQEGFHLTVSLEVAEEQAGQSHRMRVTVLPDGGAYAGEHALVTLPVVRYVSGSQEAP